VTPLRLGLVGIDGVSSDTTLQRPETNVKGP